MATRRRHTNAGSDSVFEDETTEVTDPFQNRRLSQVVAQIFESNTCINELMSSCETWEEELGLGGGGGGDGCDGRKEEIATDFIDYKEEPKNKELFRETFREIEEFFKRESPIRVKITDTDSEQSRSSLTSLTNKTDSDVPDNFCKNLDREGTPDSVEVKREVENDKVVPKRETEIIDNVHSNLIGASENACNVTSETVVKRSYSFKPFSKDFEFPSMGATAMQQPRQSKVQYSNLCTKQPVLTNSSIETTFGVTPPEQRSSLRSIRRSRSPDCKRVSPTFRWSVTSV